MSSISKRQWTTPAGEKKSAWRVDYKDNQGRRRTKQFNRKRDAEAWLTNAAYEVSRGVHTADSQSVTVAQAADLWIARAETEDRERSTIKSYRELARLHIVPFIGDEKLSRLTMPAVQKFRDDLLVTRSRAMAGKAVRALAMIITEAQRRGLVAQNVAKGVKVARSSREKAKVAIPTREELRSMLDQAQADFRPLLLTAITTGLRSSELRGLRWSDIDLKGGRIMVRQRADQWGDIGLPKSGSGHRTVPIAPVLVSELRAWKLRCPKGQKGLAFPNADGGVQWHSNILNRGLWPLQVAAGVCAPVFEKGKAKLDGEGRPVMEPRYSMHCLRHAAASAWIRQGIDLKRLQTWMGHQSIQITIDTYGHLITDEVGDAALVAAAQAELFG